MDVRDNSVHPLPLPLYFTYNLPRWFWLAYEDTDGSIPPIPEGRGLGGLLHQCPLGSMASYLYPFMLTPVPLCAALLRYSLEVQLKSGGPWLLMHNGTSIGNKKIVINAPALSPAAAPPLSAAAAAAAAPPLGPASARVFVANPKHFCESAMQHVLFRGNVSLDVCKAKCEAAVECWCYDYAAQPPHRQSSCRVGSDQNAAIEPSGAGYTAYSCTDCKPAPPPPPPRPPRVYVAGAGGKVRLTVHEERDVPIIKRVAVFAPCSAD